MFLRLFSKVEKQRQFEANSIDSFMEFGYVKHIDLAQVLISLSIYLPEWKDYQYRIFPLGLVPPNLRQFDQSIILETRIENYILTQKVHAP